MTSASRRSARVSDTATRHDPRRTHRGWRAGIPPVVLVLGAVLSFAAHFRPWEVGFLEEWPLAEIWIERGGLGFAANFAEWSLSRPLHLIPTGLGLAISAGQPWGIFLILGLVAAGQFLVTVWAVRGALASRWVSGAVALFVSLHPLWPGGYLQRFLPAQTAVLALAVTIGFLMRWLRSGGRQRLVWAAGATMLGLCVYPGTAAVTPLAALVLALAIRSPLRRRTAAVVVVLAASAAVTIYSLVIARLITPSGATYEAGNIAIGAAGGVREVVTYIASTLVNQGPWLVLAIVGVCAAGAALSLLGAIPPATGWLMAGAALVSPVGALVFFGNTAWLQDIDRLGYTTSLGIAVALVVWPVTTTGARPHLQAALAAALIAVALIGGFVGIRHWQPYIALQHQLFDELAPVVAEADGDEIVVVVDHSGTFGTQYTLPQIYISSASHLMNADDTEVWLCSLPGDPPLVGAGVCDARDTGDDLRLVRTFSVPAGQVDLFISRRG